MKTYPELSETEKQRAYDKVNNEIVEEILSGGLRFDDVKNGDTVQARIDKAVAKAEKMHTPWFAAEYLMDDPILAEFIDSMVLAGVEDALYQEPTENVIKGVVLQGVK